MMALPSSLILLAHFVLSFCFFAFWFFAFFYHLFLVSKSSSSTVLPHCTLLETVWERYFSKSPFSPNISDQLLMSEFSEGKVKT